MWFTFKLTLLQTLDDSEETAASKKSSNKPKHISPTGVPVRGRPPKDIMPMKKRLYALAKYMLDFTVSFFGFFFISAE